MAKVACVVLLGNNLIVGQIQQHARFRQVGRCVVCQGNKFFHLLQVVVVENRVELAVVPHHGVNKHHCALPFALFHHLRHLLQSFHVVAKTNVHNVCIALGKQLLCKLQHLCVGLAQKSAKTRLAGKHACANGHAVVPKVRKNWQVCRKGAIAKPRYIVENKNIFHTSSN